MSRLNMTPHPARTSCGPPSPTRREGKKARSRHLLRLRLRIARQTASGVAGMSMWLIADSDSASTSAFITDGSEPAQPASPQPLTPSGLVVAGTGWLAKPKKRRVLGARHGVVHVGAGQRAGRPRRRPCCSISAWPMPCTMPPCTWPSTSIGLTMRAEIVDRSSSSRPRRRRSPDRSRPRRRGSRSGRPTATPSMTWLTSSDAGRSGGSVEAAAQLRGQLHDADAAVGAGDGEAAARRTRCRATAASSTIAAAICWPFSITLSPALRRSPRRSPSSSASRRCRRRR